MKKITQEELNQILVQHKLWLESGGKESERANLRDAVLIGANLRDADLSRTVLRGANLRDADLIGANLRDADLDYSAFPLWCGGLDVHIDDRLANQLLYHLIRSVQFSKNTSKELKALLSDKALIEQANKFHRVIECGEIENVEQEERKSK